MYAVHIIAGSLSLVAGYAALYSAKGGALHRRAGMLFVVAMLTMSCFGVAIAITRDVAQAINLPAGLLTAYLVVTALTTVKPPINGARPLAAGAMLVALGVGVASMSFGFEAIANGGLRNGMPPFPFFMFGVIALLGFVGDVRLLHSAPLRGASRIARHLWRMSFALFIAALSFFIGQAKVIPEPIRIRPLLALPVLAVLVTLLYWMWRVRFRGSLRGITAMPMGQRT